jgi:hypothetical protein
MAAYHSVALDEPQQLLLPTNRSLQKTISGPLGDVATYHLIIAYLKQEKRQ